jgi:hypothetical protein
METKVLMVKNGKADPFLVCQKLHPGQNIHLIIFNLLYIPPCLKVSIFQTIPLDSSQELSLMSHLGMTAWAVKSGGWILWNREAQR